MAETREREYVTMSLPSNLVEKITDEILQKGGYSNRVDFVRDAIRKQLAELTA